ncbi:FKBP-type peptidyl-prolyl cis-trans isomerase [Moraxella sp. ZY210820]|uniref:FKBP-type peptidyl-prolyl cis-trans isomerase n=1 Tax=unclassified Moraxella TaxID=2685852 RepID=UPI00272F9CE6|nr:FKBP-type peptidyl-prolyl cis-trans isomerase [Moraxella sp. ZY210820]WLF84410.1 FKBP-type peptidyl-prolyl cis-trans isomerase [Moraxella sp. ZY210820]
MNTYLSASLLLCSLFFASNSIAQTVNTNIIPPSTVQQTASGLNYKVLRAGHGISPKHRDEVEILFSSYNAKGELNEGTLNGVPVILPISEMFSGLQEGLMLMQVGGIYELYIPAHLGYREEGKVNKQASTYRIELLSINP